MTQAEMPVALMAAGGAALPWTLVGVLAAVVVVGFCWWHHGRRTWSDRVRDLLGLLGQSDPGPIHGGRAGHTVWEGALEHVETQRRQTIVARTIEVKGRLTENENQRLRAVFQALPTGVLVLRSGSRVLYINEVANELLQIPEQDQPELDVAGCAAAVRAVRSLLSGDLARGVRTERIEVAQPDEVPQIFRVRLLAGSPAEGVLEDDNVQIVTFEDITAEDTSQRMKSEFVYGVSHELKTPLTSIQASLEMLVEDEDLEEADRKRLLDLSYSEAIRLSRMVVELLDLARVEAGVTEVRQELVVTRDLMEELRTVHGPLAIRKSIEMQWEVSEFVPSVRGDRDLLLQAFVNLIGNAIKYTRDQGRVEVSANVEGEELIIRIRDTGIGIPEADLGRVFDKFYRAGPAKKSSIPGTGLGLPMARFIIETHGGRIDVESTVGEGSVFTVSLPADELYVDGDATTTLQSLDPLTRSTKG